jgi:CheY-like chemotaxis protein
MKNTKAILLIEDDEMIRDGLKDFLESEGFSVLTAGNGQEGLTVFKSQKQVCLVLLDLQMPVMTGEQFLDALMESDAASLQVPVFVLTARAESLKRPDILGCLRKPVDLDLLLTKVNTYCALSS